MIQVTDRITSFYPLRMGAAIILAFLLSVFMLPDNASAVSSRQSRQQTFVSPEVGAAAMVTAIQANDIRSLSAILGPIDKQFGDIVADQMNREVFCEYYQEKNQLERIGDSKAVLHIGNSDWPFPYPLVKKENAWYFDAKAGKEEILDRRIGRNELSTVQVCLAYVDAQKEYSLGDHDRDGFFEYAQQFVSDPGQKNGLYWKSQEGEKPSPLGPAIAGASRKGYQKPEAPGAPLPYHGYYFKILKAQGKHAPGGAYDYIANGKMIGGFALVAYPAKYGYSGIMTFIVAMDGIVYQSNLGKSTAKIAESLTQFDPDKTWRMTVYGHAVK
jgi:hypothetical protein